MSNAVLSIGSNLGDRLAPPARAVEQLRPWLTAVSPVYGTPPWGPVPQDDYLNAVLLVADPAAAPADWLARAHLPSRRRAHPRRALGPAHARRGRRRRRRHDERRSGADVAASARGRARLRAGAVARRRSGGARLGGARVVDLLAALPADDIAAVRMCGDVVL